MDNIGSDLKMLNYNSNMIKISSAFFFLLLLLTIFLFIFLDPGGAILQNVQINLSRKKGERKVNITNYLNATSFKNRIKINNASVSSRNNQLYETLRLKSPNPNTTFVLLITYGRSGSSWLGAMTSQAKNTFYVFEPLQKTLPQGYYREDLICFNNNTCREPRIPLERHETILTTLYKLFTCRMSGMLPFFKDIFKNNLRSPDKKTLHKCLKSSTLNLCLKQMERICAKTTHRILKTIRISMELVNILLELWPSMKVIHLIRDPRAITHSRLQAVEFSMAQNVLSHSQDLCSRMHKDILGSFKLQDTHHNRLKIVNYEALTASPLEGARYIYRFLNMTFTETVFKWVNYTTHANGTKKRYYGIHRSDTEDVAFTWRVKMDLLKVQVIDYFCRDLYSVFGFVPMNSTKELKSFTVPSRRNMTIDGFV